MQIITKDGKRYIKYIYAGQMILEEITGEALQVLEYWEHLPANNY